MAKVIPDFSTKALKKLLVNGLASVGTKVFVDQIGDEVRGFLYASIEGFDGEDCCFVQVCVVKPIREEKYICFELLNKAKLWAKENKLEYIYFITKRESKGFERKYHFDYYGTVLRQKVSKEDYHVGNV